MVAGVAVALAALIALILRLTASPQAASPAAAAALAAPPMADVTTAAAPSPLPHRMSDAGVYGSSADIAIALDDRQALIADSALRSVMDFYLMNAKLPALREHLQRVLPPAAAQEAVSLAQRYDDYLARHDSLLAAQNFAGAPDAARLAVWQQQRHQLRVRMLGERVTEEWFGTEEAYFSQALAELAPGAEPPLPNDDEMRHQEHMRQVLRDAVAGTGRAYGANK
jgi:lipase chaperone LimK